MRGCAFKVSDQYISVRIKLDMVVNLECGVSVPVYVGPEDYIYV